MWVVRQADAPFVCFGDKPNKGLSSRTSTRPGVGKGTQEQLGKGIREGSWRRVTQMESRQRTAEETSWHEIVQGQWGRQARWVRSADVIFSYTCSCRIDTDAMNNRRKKTSLEKYCTSYFIVRVRKGYSRFACERVLETEQNWNILTPTHMAVCVVYFLFSGCSIGGPEAHSAGWWLSLLHLISNFSGPQTPSVFPRAPSAGCGFPYHSRLSPSPTLTGTVTVLTPTQSPTRSLKSHVWSSSSGNNCHAVHRSLFSGVSVYECTMGIFFYLVLFRQPISAHTISSHNCH